MNRTLRFLAPNLITSIGMLLGLLAMVATYEQRFVSAGWLIIWSVLLDRIDGGVARLLKASSDFGVQMDSFADFLNFGVAPAFLMFSFLRWVPGLGFDAGGLQMLLAVACVAWVLANALRLARFNVASAGGPASVYFGVPTTLAAGLLVIWYIVLLKYSPASLGLGEPDFLGFPRILGPWEISPSTYRYLPIAMLFGAGLMVSNVPIPKLGRKSSRLLTWSVLFVALVGYACGYTRSLPDLMAWMPSSWLVWSLVWGVVSPNARGLQPPAWR